MLKSIRNNAFKNITNLRIQPQSAAYLYSTKHLNSLYFEKLTTLLQITCNNLRKLKWYNKNGNIESIVKKNESLQLMKQAKETVSDNKTFIDSVEFFIKHFEQLSSSEKAILYRLLGTIGDRRIDTNLVTNLELDFYENFHEYDLNTILNFSIGAQLIQNSTIHFYARTTDHVYRKLLANIRFIYVNLKVLKLNENQFEYKFLNQLDQIGNIQIHPSDFQITLRIIQSYENFLTADVYRRLLKQILNQSEIKNLVARDQIEMLNFLASKKMISFTEESTIKAILEENNIIDYMKTFNTETFYRILTLMKSLKIELEDIKSFMARRINNIEDCSELIQISQYTQFHRKSIESKTLRNKLELMVNKFDNSLLAIDERFSISLNSYFNYQEHREFIEKLILHNKSLLESTHFLNTLSTSSEAIEAEVVNYMSKSAIFRPCHLLFLLQSERYDKIWKKFVLNYITEHLSTNKNDFFVLQKWFGERNQMLNVMKNQSFNKNESFRKNQSFYNKNLCHQYYNLVQAIDKTNWTDFELNQLIETEIYNVFELLGRSEQIRMEAEKNMLEVILGLIAENELIKENVDSEFYEKIKLLIQYCMIEYDYDQPWAKDFVNKKKNSVDEFCRTKYLMQKLIEKAFGRNSIDYEYDCPYGFKIDLTIGLDTNGDVAIDSADTVYRIAVLIDYKRSDLKLKLLQKLYPVIQLNSTNLELFTSDKFNTSLYERIIRALHRFVYQNES